LTGFIGQPIFSLISNVMAEKKRLYLHLKTGTLGEEKEMEIRR
jgi:hypothetical protein